MKMKSKKWGFILLMSSMHFDFLIFHSKLFLTKSKTTIFENTLFVITGDHGLPSFNAQHIKPGHLAHGLARFHVPLIFYAKASS